MLRWPAMLLCAASLAVVAVGLRSPNAERAADTLLAARRVGSAEARTALSAEEAAALRQEVGSRALLSSAAQRLSPNEGASAGLSDELKRCAEVVAEAGKAEVHVICRSGDAQWAAEGANALAAALVASRRRGASVGSAFEDRRAEQEFESAKRDYDLFSSRNSVELLDSQRAAAKTRIAELEGRSKGPGAEARDLEREVSRQRALLDSLDRMAQRRDELKAKVETAQRALGISATPGSGGADDGLRLSVLAQASVTAGGGAPRWEAPAAAAGLAAAMLAMVGFLGRGKRRFRSVDEVAEMFGAPVVVLERGGRTNVS